MDASDDLVGTTFGRWARYHGPQMHGGKPVLGGKTFRAQRDPWRGVSRTAFGADYLKYYARGKVGEGAVRLMQLNRYDAEDVPCYGFDVLVQRLGVYVQVKDGVCVCYNCVQDSRLILSSSFLTLTLSHTATKITN